MILSWDQVAAVALAVGWSPAEAVIATSITEPESGRNASIIQQGQPYATTGWGLWQITPGNSVPQFGIDRQILKPLNNGRAAHYKWRGAGGWTPWTTWVNGLNRPYLGEAEQAVAHVAHLSKKQLEQLVKGLGGGSAGPAPQVTAAENWSPQVSLTSHHFGTAARHLVGYAAGISGLEPKFHPPGVHVPNPKSVLLPQPKGKLR